MKIFRHKQRFLNSLRPAPVILLALLALLLSLLAGKGQQKLYAQGNDSLEYIYAEQYTREFLSEYVFAIDDFINSYVNSISSLAPGLSSDGSLSIGWFIPNFNVSFIGGTKFIFPVSSTTEVTRFLKKTIRNNELLAPPETISYVYSGKQAGNNVILNLPTFVAFIGIRFNFDIKRYNLDRLVFSFVYGLPISTFSILKTLSQIIDYSAKSFITTTKIYSLSISYNFFNADHIRFYASGGLTFINTLVALEEAVSSSTYTIESVDAANILPGSYELDYTISSEYESSTYLGAFSFKAEFPLKWLKPYLELRANILFNSSQQSTHNVTYSLLGATGSGPVLRLQDQTFQEQLPSKGLDPVVPSLITGINFLYGFNFSFEVSFFRGKQFTDAFSLNIFFNFDI